MRLLHVVAFSKEITLVGSNQGNSFENETACSKRILKTTVATQLKRCIFLPNAMRQQLFAWRTKFGEIEPGSTKKF